MSERHLHIVSFDIPYPADYGGAIDVFHKVRTLAAMGVRIHLHCFHYDRQHSDVLKNICEKVYYYPRNMNKTLLINPLPFIIVSRHHDVLLRHLKEDDHPILFEGKHTCYYLDHPDLESRRKYVRTHNVESDYYASLAALEMNPFKRLYFKIESKKLKRYQPNLKEADHLFCISEKDRQYFSKFNEHCSVVLPFHANDKVNFIAEKEDYCLYHGNLAVGENEQAARFLVNEVFADSPIQFKIFGNGASRSLKREIAGHSNMELIEGVRQELYDLVTRAQVNVLPTFQATGMKLKLLFSLHNGGHVLVNDPMVNGTGAESLVHVAEGAADFKSKTAMLMNKEFDSTNEQERRKILEEKFSNEVQGRNIVSEIF
ncbi:MAG: glycosyltransferase family 1 protein [Flavobacteriales bacterium]|nr:glycosyltransferase family 1 protein [Flavobacteriales bacterium]